MGPLETTTMEQFRAPFETNVFALVGLTKALLPAMRHAGGGTIVNTSSLSAENAIRSVPQCAARSSAAK